MKRYAYSIFCDDIRNEVNGKASFMGVVGSLLYVNTFPCVLPKLCILITAMTDNENPFRELSFKVLVDDESAFDVKLGPEEVKQLYQNQGLIDDPKGFAAQVMVTISPLNLEKPCKIKVVVMADDENIECAGLQISLAPEGTVLV